MRTPLLVIIGGTLALVLMPLIIAHLPTARAVSVPAPPPATWSQP